MDFTTQYEHYRQRVERGLDQLLPSAATAPGRLHEAMRYSLLAGGKRLRPVLVLAAADSFAPTTAGETKLFDALPAAVAIECVHTYSLIHDDLPCMDNDDLRRGRPTCHKQFDEATALLAGDALLTEAFILLSTHYPADLGLRLVRELAGASGSRELIGGQMDDLLAEKKPTVSAAELNAIHLRKTAAMITAALAMGGLIARPTSEKQLGLLRTAGRHLGLAFQIIDDILDATADTATLGKTAGKDAKADKTTYLKLHGLDASRQQARAQSDAALTALQALPGHTDFLTALVREMAARTH